jgi:hypothetical protein
VFRDPALLSVGAATLLTIVAFIGFGPWVTRSSLFTLWIGSREPHSTLAEFSRRSFSKREVLLDFWLTTFLVALLVFSVLLPAVLGRAHAP